MCRLWWEEVPGPEAGGSGRGEKTADSSDFHQTLPNASFQSVNQEPLGRIKILGKEEKCSPLELGPLRFGVRPLSFHGRGVVYTCHTWPAAVTCMTPLIGLVLFATQQVLAIRVPEVGSGFIHTRVPDWAAPSRLRGPSGLNWGHHPCCALSFLFTWPSWHGQCQASSAFSRWLLGRNKASGGDCYLRYQTSGSQVQVYIEVPVHLLKWSRCDSVGLGRNLHL